MAWREQCRVAFKANADARVWRGKSVSDVLRELSEESDIPLGTLNRWYYREKKESYSKNAVTAEETHEGAGIETSEWPLCSKCGRKPVEKAYKDKEGKPHKSGLCWSCRRKESETKKAEAERRKFEETPVSSEAERCWKEIAEKLSDLTGSAVIEKVSREVLSVVLEEQSLLDTLIAQLFDVSTFKTESG